MILYKIGGLGADERVFEKLTLNTPSVSIKWLVPETQESLKDYTFRISKQIDQSEEFGIIAVSFGGIIAIELSKILNPKTIILISSVSISDELPYKSLRIPLSRLVKLIPGALIKPPQFMMNFMFGAVDKELLSKIIRDTDPSFIRWALHKILTWRHNNGEGELFRIHGSTDRLIPLKGIAHIIKDGGHFMIVDRADELSVLINEHIQSC